MNISSTMPRWMKEEYRYIETIRKMKEVAMPVVAIRKFICDHAARLDKRLQYLGRVWN